MPYKNILIATDLDDHCKKMLTKARELSQHFDGKVTLLHVIELDPSAEHIFVDQADYQHSIMAHARDRIAELLEASQLKIDEQLVEFGSPRRTILETAKQNHADLIIVGSHGRHGLQRLLGSTAHSVVQGAECDVFVVRAK